MTRLIKFPKSTRKVRKYLKLPKQPYRIIKQASSKYKSIKQEYRGGVYHSKKEARYAMELDLRVKARDIKSWRRQVKLQLDSNGYHICDYYIDFEITHNNGILEFIEVKGFETDVWRLKWKLLESIYGRNPNYRLTVVK